MLYPSFETGSTSRVVSRPPLFRVKFINFIQNAAASAPGGPSSAGGTAASSGLVCTVGGFSYSPDIDAGFMHDKIGVVYPQTIKLSCDLAVLHVHKLGYDGNARATPNFPYGQPGGHTPQTNPAAEAASQPTTEAQATAAQEGMLGSGMAGVRRAVGSSGNNN